MIGNLNRIVSTLISVVIFAATLTVSAVAGDREIPQGTRFMVELRDKLEARKAKPGKKFDAITLQALETTDGTVVPAGSKLKGQVSYVEDNKMVLRFEQIETQYG